MQHTYSARATSPRFLVLTVTCMKIIQLLSFIPDFSLELQMQKTHCLMTGMDCGGPPKCNKSKRYFLSPLMYLPAHGPLKRTGATITLIIQVKLMSHSDPLLFFHLYQIPHPTMKAPKLICMIHNPSGKAIKQSATSWGGFRFAAFANSHGRNTPVITGFKLSS